MEIASKRALGVLSPTAKRLTGKCIAAYGGALGTEPNSWNLACKADIGGRGVEAEEKWSRDFPLLKFVPERSVVSLSRVVRSMEYPHLHEPRTFIEAWIMNFLPWRGPRTSLSRLDRGPPFQGWTTEFPCGLQGLTCWRQVPLYKLL